jgi:hypothetical protein
MYAGLGTLLLQISRDHNMYKAARYVCQLPNKADIQHSLLKQLLGISRKKLLCIVSEYSGDYYLVGNRPIQISFFFLYFFVFSINTPLPPLRGQHTAKCHPKWQPI